jgi:hypothetical protein
VKLVIVLLRFVLNCFKDLMALSDSVMYCSMLVAALISSDGRNDLEVSFNFDEALPR